MRPRVTDMKTNVRVDQLTIGWMDRHAWDAQGFFTCKTSISGIFTSVKDQLTNQQTDWPTNLWTHPLIEMQVYI